MSCTVDVSYTSLAGHTAQSTGLFLEPDHQGPLPRKDHAECLAKSRSIQDACRQCVQLRSRWFRQRNALVCGPSRTILHAVLNFIFPLLRYEGEEEFFCDADTCTQQDSNGGSDWSCQNLKCTCRPGATFCGTNPVCPRAISHLLSTHRVVGVESLRHH